MNEFFQSVNDSAKENKTAFQSPILIPLSNSDSDTAFLLKIGSTISQENRCDVNHELDAHNGHRSTGRLKKRKRWPEEQHSRRISAEDFEMRPSKDRNEVRNLWDRKIRKGASVASSDICSSEKTNCTLAFAIMDNRASTLSIEKSAVVSLVNMERNKRKASWCQPTCAMNKAFRSNLKASRTNWSSWSRIFRQKEIRLAMAMYVAGHKSNTTRESRDAVEHGRLKRWLVKWLGTVSISLTTDTYWQQFNPVPLGYTVKTLLPESVGGFQFRTLSSERLTVCTLYIRVFASSSTIFSRPYMNKRVKHQVHRRPAPLRADE